MTCSNSLQESMTEESCDRYVAHLTYNVSYMFGSDFSGFAQLHVCA